MNGATRPNSLLTEDHEVSGIEEILDEARRESHTILHLNYKGLKELPSSLLDKPFETIQKLFLKRNRLTTLPTSIGFLKALKVLYLPSNNISSLPEEICELENLECLDISQNCLMSLPSKIGKLPKLEKLYLSSNVLTELPSEIGGLQNLKVLIVTNNQLECLPEELCRCSKLHTLHVDKNRLYKLPCQIVDLISLRELSLMGNFLTYIPMLLGARSSLTCVNLTNNPYLLTVIGNSHHFGAVHSVFSKILGCGFRDPLDLGLNPKRMFNIHNCRVVLPPEIRSIWPATEKNRQPSSLLELTLRTCHKYEDYLDIHRLPQPLVRILRFPVAICAHVDCTVPIFTCGYAIADPIKGPVNNVTLYHSVRCVPLLILRLLDRSFFTPEVDHPP